MRGPVPVPEFRHGSGRAAELRRTEAARAVRGQVPDEVFGEPFVPPVSDGQVKTGRMAQGAACRKPPGFRQGRQAEVAERRAFSVEFLLDEPTFQPDHGASIKNLVQLAIDASIRFTDAEKFRARVESS